MRRGRARTTELEYDPIAVDRLVKGEHGDGTPTAADGWEAVRRLNALGFSDGQVAYRTGYSRRNVAYIRGQLGIPAALPSSGANRASWRVEAPTLHWRQG